MSYARQAYEEMQDLLGSGQSGQVEGKRIVYPTDPDQGIRLHSGDRHNHIAWKGGNRMILSGPWNFTKSGPPTHEILTNVQLTNCRKNGWGRTLWGMNVYEVTRKFDQIDCLTDKIGIYPEPTNGGRTEGHGDYLHLIASAEPSWTRCVFKNLMGNAIQAARRVGESTIEPVPDYASPQRIARIDDCEFIDVGQGRERGSFAISWFAPGAGLEVIDTAMRVSDRNILRGGLLVGDPQSYVQRGETEQRTRVVRVSKFALPRAINNATHPGVQIQGVDSFRSDGLINLSANPRRFVFDEDCGNIDARFFGDWIVVKRTLKVPGGVPQKVGFNYETVKTVEGRGRLVR